MPDHLDRWMSGLDSTCVGCWWVDIRCFMRHLALELENTFARITATAKQFSALTAAACLRVEPQNLTVSLRRYPNAGAKGPCTPGIGGEAMGMQG